MVGDNDSSDKLRYRDGGTHTYLDPTFVSVGQERLHCVDGCDFSFGSACTGYRARCRPFGDVLFLSISFAALGVLSGRQAQRVDTLTHTLAWFK